MKDDETAQIEFDLSYAIRFKCHWSPKCRPDEGRAAVMAKQIRQQLELAGVKLKKRPPAEPHGLHSKLK